MFPYPPPFGLAQLLILRNNIMHTGSIMLQMII